MSNESVRVSKSCDLEDLMIERNQLHRQLRELQFNIKQCEEAIKKELLATNAIEMLKVDWYRMEQMAEQAGIIQSHKIKRIKR